MKTGSITTTGERTRGKYSVELRDAVEKAMAAPETNRRMLSVGNPRIVQADRTGIKTLVVIRALVGLDKVYLHRTKSCSPCVKVTVPNIVLNSGTILKTRPVTVLRTDVAVISIISAGGSGYSVAFMDEASEHVSDLLIKNTAEAAKLL